MYRLTALLVLGCLLPGCSGERSRMEGYMRSAPAAAPQVSTGDGQSIPFNRESAEELYGSPTARFDVSGGELCVWRNPQIMRSLAFKSDWYFTFDEDGEFLPPDPEILNQICPQCFCDLRGLNVAVCPKCGTQRKEWFKPN